MITELCPEATALLAAVRDPLDDAIARLPWFAPVRVHMGVVEGAYELQGDAVVLSRDLLGPDPVVGEDLHHGALGLDRWKRATASVLEGVLLRGLPEDLPLEGPAWVRAGLVIYLVDQAEPALGVAAPEIVRARRTADLANHPRAGVAVLASRDDDPVGWARSCLASGTVPVKDFVEAGRAIFAARPSAPVLQGIDLPEAVDIPVSIDPWTWKRIEVPAHPRGGRVRVEGVGGVVPAWAPADTVLRALAGAGARGCRLVADVGGPVGTWEVTSAGGFGRILGARGLRFIFHPSGVFEVELADAFVGGVEELDAAEEVGTSGSMRGRWTVAAARQLSLGSLVPMGVSLHGRSEGAPVVPTGEAGLAGALKGLADHPWRWSTEGGRLQLDGVMFGAPVEIRLKRVP